MRKFLFCLAMMMASMCVNAQVLQAPEGKYAVFCDVMGYNTWGFGKVKARLDMGRTQPNKEDYEYIYEGGRKKKFNTMMEVLDYMSKRGWNLHSTCVVSEGMAKQNVIHFLMVKFVSSDREIDAGLELGIKE